MTGSVPERSVPRAEITEYLLKADHPVDASKARFFAWFGFARDRWEIMAAALGEHPDRNPLETTITNRRGTKDIVRYRIRSPGGRDPCIRTVWNVPPGRTGAQFVTAYPAEESA